MTPEYLSLEHDFFRGLLAHHLENCPCCFIYGNETNYQCNCTYQKVVSVVRIAMPLAPVVYMVFKVEAMDDHFHFVHFLRGSCDVSAYTVFSILL